MASLILSSAGSAVLGPIGGFLGALGGSALDQALTSALTPPLKQASRLATLKVQGGGEGVPIPIVFGRARVTGQVIWASQFKEHRTRRRVGGKAGQRVVENSYSISFALGLCDGPIRGIGRVWANGERFDLSSVPHRLYLGQDDQMPDPLIEAIEGLEAAPAYRGLAYLVFEDFPLSGFNDRIPNLSLEIMAAGPDTSDRPALESLARAVCLIPGAGEFAYATTPIKTAWNEGVAAAENLHAAADRSDLLMSLDQLGRDLPHVDHVSLVVAWFGTDLRAGMCKIEPRVDQAAKPTSPRAWQVAGLTRSQAAQVSYVAGRPAYGGSPDDASVVEALVELKARGHQVTLNPFVMMDIPSGNSLANPYAGTPGAVGQPAYPWRGRITCFPGPNQAGTANGQTALLAQIAAFFGSAQASHFRLAGQTPVYSGPVEWSYRRFILHQAMLAKAAGGVEAFLIGSELVGLTRLWGPDGQFPAVSALKALAGEVRLILGPDVRISYGADWTEYGGYNPPGTNDLRFPLDPLWADPNVDFLALDWYPPLTDARAGDPVPDRPDLQATIEGGEGYDFYYASEAARQTRIRTAITDGAYQEPWVWRVKDIRNFWSLPHHERFAGVRQAMPTDWIAQSKPIRLMELGCPAVDKGGNRPSVFPDPKSSEAGLPPFSTGRRDDGEQRRLLEAYLSYWADHAPVSVRDGRPMLRVDHMYLWAWDGRPYPHFPQLQHIWGDGPNAETGHWLAGRAGYLRLSDLFDGLAARAGLSTLKADQALGYIEGFVIDGPTSVRAALESLLQPLGLEAWPRDDGLFIQTVPPPWPSFSLTTADLQQLEDRADLSVAFQPGDTNPSVHLTTFDSTRDFEPATYRAEHSLGNGPAQLVNLPVVVDAPARQLMARNILAAQSGEVLSATINPLLGIRLDVGDRFQRADGRIWRIDRLAGAWHEHMTASPAPNGPAAPLASHGIEAQPFQPTLLAPPKLVVLDLPAPFVSTTAPKPLVGAYTSPWPGAVDVRVDDRLLARLTRPASVGHLVQALPQTAISRRLGLTCDVWLGPGVSLPDYGRAALVDAEGLRDIMSWDSLTWVADQTWQLAGLVRGYHGEAHAPSLAAGTGFILLDDALIGADLDPALFGLKLLWNAAPTEQPLMMGTIEARFLAHAGKPWSPGHVKAKRTSAGISMTWVRRASGDGDGWGVTQVPFGSGVDRYRLTLLSPAQQVLRVVEVAGPSYLYPAADELADFGSVQSKLQVSVSQLDGHGQAGAEKAAQLIL